MNLSRAWIFRADVMAAVRDNDSDIRRAQRGSPQVLTPIGPIPAFPNFKRLFALDRSRRAQAWPAYRHGRCQRPQRVDHGIITAGGTVVPISDALHADRVVARLL
jgi:hypothetical protein